MRSSKLESLMHISLFVLTVLIFLGGIGWFINQLVLRGGWSDAKLGLTQSFVQAYDAGAVIERGGELVPADSKALDEYYEFFIDSGTVLMKKRKIDTTDQTVYLHLPDTTLTFTPVENGYYTVVQWELGGKNYSYELRGHVAFEHLDRYFVEARYRAQKAAAQQQ